MVIDSSAIIAILLKEPEAGAIAASIEQDPLRIISAGNWLEVHMVLQTRLGPAGAMIGDAFLRELRVEIVPFDAVLAQMALTAWRRFGKSNHPAKLNMGDCIAYATAMLKNQRLLFKGTDFSQTDVARVEY